MLVPPIVGYTLIPFGSGIWEKIYYKFYELGNNGLYIPSATEVEEEETSAPGTSTSGGDDINVEG